MEEIGTSTAIDIRRIRDDTKQRRARRRVPPLRARRLGACAGAERARAAAAARAHDARLAELHGVIAELVRRRAADKQARAIPEEEGSVLGSASYQPPSASRSMCLTCVHEVLLLVVQNLRAQQY
ncbi:hypothetical protein MSG28_016155 [Choristoneura fumiferana]|uniref:Uncharacterized protein n=1 Tax=Choristoneura fumiferana TaxID=7141 RepID=A0ACC0K5K0_CHOFU|nr:hypothetical protein MSG28_016155 [Choristoneura fumiferana]